MNNNEIIKAGGNTLFERIVSILEQARSNVIKAVNSNMVIAYWLIGREECWEQHFIVFSGIELRSSQNVAQPSRLRIKNTSETLVLHYFSWLKKRNRIKMIFIASKKSENKFTVHAEIPFKSDKVKYQSNFHVCPNPACGCDDLIVKLSLDDENIAGVASEKAEFIISISARKLNEERISPEHLSFARTIIRHFDEEDWKILEQAFFSERCKLVNESPAEKFDVDFNFIGDGYSAIDDGQMVPYSEVFPFSDDLFFEIDGEKCIALPMFCLARGCKCSNAVLQTFRLENPNPYLSIRVDYKKKKFSCFENIRWNSSAIDFDKLRNILLTSFPDLFQRLKIKHAKLAKVYKISRKKHLGSSDNWENTIGYASDDIPEEIHQQTKKKIGRNDPCPCGSGKKYKKCCLR